jgi:hypothetical protein
VTIPALPNAADWEAVTSRADVLGDGTIGGEKTLGVSGRREPLQAPVPLAGRLVRLLGAIVQIAMLAVLHPRQHLLLCSTIARKLVRDDHPAHTPSRSTRRPIRRQRGDDILAPDCLSLWFGVMARCFDDVIHRYAAADLAYTFFEAFGTQDVAHGGVGLDYTEWDSCCRQVCV